VIHEYQFISERTWYVLRVPFEGDDDD